MTMPPLWPQTLALADAVHAMADERGLSEFERRAALGLLGQVVASGETGFGRALLRISEALDDRAHLDGLAAQYAREANARPARTPATQEQMRWDAGE